MRHVNRYRVIDRRPRKRRTDTEVQQMEERFYATVGREEGE